MMAAWCSGVVLLAASMSAQGGGAARHEAVIKELLANVDKITTTLGAIKDEETSKEAVAALKLAAKEWAAIRKKAEDLPPPSQEEKDQLEKKFKAPLEMAQKKLFGEIGRVRMVPGGRDALAAINEVLGTKKTDKKK